MVHSLIKHSNYSKIESHVHGNCAMVEEEEEDGLSTILGLKGCWDDYHSVGEFTEDLNELDLLSEKSGAGCVFWKEENFANNTAIQPQSKFLHVLRGMNKRRPYGNWVVQFWAPEEVEERVLYPLRLTTSIQPFALLGWYPLCKGCCWYRKQSRDHVYYFSVDEELGPPGRAFRNGHPESTPDLRLYTTTEYPLRDHAGRCGLRSYLALPLFHDDTSLLQQPCLGVLEVLSLFNGGIHGFELEEIESTLKAAGLRSTHDYRPPWRNLKYNEAQATKEMKEMQQMLELAIEEVPQLHVAQVWVNCKQCGNNNNRSDNSICMERAIFVSTEDKKINSYDCSPELWSFLKTHELCNKRSGEGIAGRVLMSSSCLCWNICDFSILDYPMAHYAKKARLSSCFAICLRNKQNVRDLYVVEFFVHQQPPLSFLPILLRIMEVKLKSSFEVASGRQLGEEKLPVEVLVAKNTSLTSTSFQQLGHSRNNMMSLLEEGNDTNQFIVTQETGLHYHQYPTGFTTTTIMVGQIKDLPLPTKLGNCSELYTTYEFREYLEEPQLSCSQVSEPPKHNPGWLTDELLEYVEEHQLSWSQPGFLFWSSEYEGVIYNNPSSIPNLIREMIFHILRELTSDKYRESYFLAQYWAPSEDGSCLLTSGQPFVLGSLRKGLCWYRKQCVNHYYILCGDEGGAKEEMIGPPGRVFRNGYPESTPNLCYYSVKEFPLRQDAVRCGLRGYAVFPVFDLHPSHCVGVLEFATSSSRLHFDVIERAFQKATLRSNHIEFKPSNPPQMGRDFLQIDEMLELAYEIPELSGALVWAPCKKCPDTNNLIRCWQIARGWGFDFLQYTEAGKFQRVQIGKRIAGRALASKNKSCYCGNLCDLGITENPLAHYALRGRFNACFAICLQSSENTKHSRNLYVIEFFLHPGSRTLASFLQYLLPIMKQELKSFKVASGQQLGEELVIDVLEIRKGDGDGLTTTTSYDIDHHPNKFPVRFEIIQYESQEIEEPQHEGDQQPYNLITGSMSSALNVAEAEENNITTPIEQEMEHEHVDDQQACDLITGGMKSAPNVAEAEENNITTATEEGIATKKMKRGRQAGSLNISYPDLEKQLGNTLKIAAEKLGVSKSTLKRVCRDYNITRWPSNMNRKNPSLFKKAKASEVVQGPQQEQVLISSGINHPPQDDSSLPQAVPETNVKHTQDVQAVPETNVKHTQDVPENDCVKVRVKATFEGKACKFLLGISSTLEKLREEIAKRYTSLRHESFIMEYLDEDGCWILLACDDDWHLCAADFALVAVGSSAIIQIRVSSINN